MKRFENIKITLPGDEANKNDQRFDIFCLNPFSMKSFSTCNVLVTWLKSEIIGRPWKEQMFMPTNAFSGELCSNCNGFFSYQKKEMTNPSHFTIKSFRKNQRNLLVIPLQKMEKWIPSCSKENLLAFLKFQNMEQILIVFQAQDDQVLFKKGRKMQRLQRIQEIASKQLYEDKSK